MLASIAILISFAASAAASPTALISRTSAPSNCLTVGKGGKYPTVQSAVDALDEKTTKAQCIYIAAGTYHEQVELKKDFHGPLTIYGQTADSSTYAHNTVTIVQGRSQDDPSLSNQRTATLIAKANHLRVYNINLVNSRGQGAQALALSASGDKQGYYGCQFKGFQDTVFSEKSDQVFARCNVEGATDYVFNKAGTMWFQKCVFGSVAASEGHITASGRSSPSERSWIVINSSEIKSAPGQTVKPHSVELGRPWREYARVAVQGTSMTNIIKPEGWGIWSEKTPIDHVEFYEYGNYGPGAKGPRAPFAKERHVDLATVFGEGNTRWIDSTYFH